MSVECESGGALAKEGHFLLDGERPNSVSLEQFPEISLVGENRKDVGGHPIGADTERLQTEALVVSNSSHADVVEATISYTFKILGYAGHTPQRPARALAVAGKQVLEVTRSLEVSSEDLV